MFQLDVKHALEKWSFFWCLELESSPFPAFASSATFLFSPNRALYNGAPKTIRRVHYFSGENANKITAILMVALPTLLRYLCDGLTSSFSYRTICRTCNLHYLIIITTLVFFSWLIYSSIFSLSLVLLSLVFGTLSLYFRFLKNLARSSIFIVFQFLVARKGVEKG